MVEPLIKSSGGAVKPDLVFWNSEASYVLDVAVEGDWFDPDTGHERKVTKYSVVPEITALVQRSRFPFRNANQVPTFTAFKCYQESPAMPSWSWAASERQI